MRKWINLCMAALLAVVCLNLQAEERADKSPKKEHAVRLTADGPYVCYQPGGGVKIIRVTAEGEIKAETYAKLPDGFELPVVSHDGKYAFQVPLHPVIRQPWKDDAAKKTFVMSDPHANLECFVSLLQANGVVDQSLAWSFGKNRLMIIGDIFDRGYDATQIFWLVYKLEAEAERAGGKVYFLLGNHEPMELSNDLRYAKGKYKALADSLGVEYASLYGEDTELGRWLGTRNTMQIIGDNLYVHAGLGRAFYERKLEIPVVNGKMSEVLFLKNKERKQVSPLHAFLYGSEGPIWYRGLVRTAEKYKPCPADTLQMILDRYGAERIIVGHTIFDDISTFYGGKVVGVNVDNKENRKEHRGRGILIEDGVFYVVGDQGKMHRLFE